MRAQKPQHPVNSVGKAPQGASQVGALQSAALQKHMGNAFVQGQLVQAGTVAPPSLDAGPALEAWWTTSPEGEGAVADAPVGEGDRAGRGALGEATTTAAPAGSGADAPSGPLATDLGKKSSDPAINALMAWKPAGPTGPQGEASWLLAAIATNVVSAFEETARQLGQIVKGEVWVHSTEREPARDKLRSGAEKLKNKEKVKQVDEAVKRNGPGNYDVKVEDAAVLTVLVTLTRSRVQEWIDGGQKRRRPLFRLGDMVRGDVGFGGSRHQEGRGVDLDGMNFGNSTDVIALLDGLPPGRVGNVFPDSSGSVHISVDKAGRYEFGFPFGGSFFPANLEPEGATARAAKQADANGETSAKVDVLKWGETPLYEVSGAREANGKWAWNGKTIKDWLGARKALDSANPALKKLLSHLDSGGRPQGQRPAPPKGG